MQLTDSEIDEIIRLGGLAPSGGNAQPWKIRVDANCLELGIQPERAGSFLDVGYLASLYSLGSFLENVCLASTSLGLTYEVQLHEFRIPTDPVATVRYRERSEGLEKDPLYEQIPRRHTNRHLHQGALLPNEVVESLRAAMRPWPRLGLATLSDSSGKKRAAAILGRSNALSLRHPVLFHQMMNELRWSTAEAQSSRDGVAISTLELPPPAVILLRTLRRYPTLRWLLPRPALEKMPEAAVMGCSHLCVQTIRGAPSTENFVNAGRALQRAWLQASALELAVQPLAILPFLVLRARRFQSTGFSPRQADEVLKLGADLNALYSLGEDEFPVFIFRLSAPAAAASERALRLPHRELYARA